MVPNIFHLKDEFEDANQRLFHQDTSSDDDLSSDGTDSSQEDSEYSEDQSDESDDDDVFEDAANNPIYPGAPISVAESILAIFTVALRFNVPGVLLSSILSLIELHCVKPNNCVKTLYKLKKFFSNINTPLIRHYYCSICFSKSDKQFCNICRNDDNITYFIEVPILEQLASFYKRSKFRENLINRNTREKKNAANFEDIYDGYVYNSLPTDFLANHNNITFTWNSDGVPLFKSSKISIWPLYFMINELPYSLRIKKENMILAGLWFGPHKPLVNMFLEVFRKDLQKLYRGVTFVVANMIDTLRVRALILGGTCDLCAKATFLNIQQFNSKFGCPNCKIETIRYENVQTYPFAENLELRTTNESLLFAETAQNTNTNVYGVKGPTILSQIVHDYVNSTAIDIMHCIYQGITKKLLSFWFETENRTQAYSLLAFINVVDEKIKCLALPSFLPRIPRKINDHAHWKASELKLFLLVYSLPVLKCIMSNRYFEHHILLVYGITLLSLSSISEQMITDAKRALNEYVSRFEVLYGRKNLVCNVHLLLHLPEEVRKFGPLWTMSCFPFENLNGVLKSYVHGSRYPELQIYSSVSTFLSLSELKQKYLRPGTSAFEFCKKTDASGTRRYKTKYLQQNIFAVGLYKKSGFIPAYIINALNMVYNVINIDKCHLFKRLLKNGMYYESEAHAYTKKSNSSCIKYITDNVSNIGIINQFITVCNCECEASCTECNEDCLVYAIVTKCIVERNFICPVTENYIPTILTCDKIDNDYVAVNVKNIINVCYYFKVDDKYFVVEPTNIYEIE